MAGYIVMHEGDSRLEFYEGVVKALSMAGHTTPRRPDEVAEEIDLIARNLVDLRDAFIKENE